MGPAGGFSGAHTARRSTRAKEGFGEAPQSGYVGKAPVAPGELDPDLAKSLGLDDDAQPSGETPGGPALLRGKYGENLGVAATAHALESLLREGPARIQREALGAAPAAAAGQIRGRPAAS